MSVDSSAVTASMTATIAARGTSDGCNVHVVNTGATDVFLGGPTVTAATGFTLSSGARHTVGRLEPGELLYVIAATTGSIRVLRTSV